MRVSRRPSLAGIDRLLIDGNNLLHRLSGSADPGSLRLLLPGLQAAIPPTIEAVVVLDGHPAPGTGRGHRVRRGMGIRHAGSLAADDALLNLVRDIAPHARAGTTLVSDDRSLADRARHLGVRTQRLAWLEGMLADRGGGAGRSIGRSRPPQGPQPDEVEHEPWRPGRGATRKRGNPRRGAR